LVHTVNKWIENGDMIWCSNLFYSGVVGTKILEHFCTWKIYAPNESWNIVFVL